MFFHCFHVLQRESALCRASGAGSGRSHSFLHGDISDYSVTASFALLGRQVREPGRALASESGVLAPLEELYGPVVFFFISFLPVLVGPNSPSMCCCLGVPGVIADKSPLTCYDLESYAHLDADDGRARGSRQVHNREVSYRPLTIVKLFYPIMRSPWTGPSL